MHVNMNVCMHVCVYVCVHVCAHVCVTLYILVPTVIATRLNAHTALFYLMRCWGKAVTRNRLRALYTCSIFCRQYQSLFANLMPENPMEKASQAPSELCVYLLDQYTMKPILRAADEKDSDTQ